MSINPAPQHITPACPHFGTCGGCAWQHLTPHDYATLKQQKVMEALGRARLVPRRILPPVFIGAGTRRRTVFRAQKQSGQVEIGYTARASSDPVWISECPVLVPQIMDGLPMLRALLSALLTSGQEVDVAVLATENGLDVLLTPFDEKALTLKQRTAIADQLAGSSIIRLSAQKDTRATSAPMLQTNPVTLRLGDVTVAVPPGVFLQPSMEGQNALITAVNDALGRSKNVADLFCGLGTFALSIASGASGRKVDAYDADGAAIEALAQAVKARPHMRAIKRQLYADPVTAQELKPYDAIIFDPPRAGAKAQAAHIAKSGVKTIVAVSCNPQSFVTDAAALMAGGYAFDTLQIIDQFTWSNHIELVARFTL